MRIEKAKGVAKIFATPFAFIDFFSALSLFVRHLLIRHGFVNNV